mgnify:CR=1 FL=1
MEGPESVGAVDSLPSDAGVARGSRSLEEACRRVNRGPVIMAGVSRSVSTGIHSAGVGSRARRQVIRVLNSPLMTSRWTAATTVDTA